MKPAEAHVSGESTHAEVVAAARREGAEAMRKAVLAVFSRSIAECLPATSDRPRRKYPRTAALALLTIDTLETMSSEVRAILLPPAEKGSSMKRPTPHGRATPAEQLKAKTEAHDRYHESGMCYGDSHASFLQEIERLERLAKAAGGDAR